MAADNEGDEEPMAVGYVKSKLILY